MNSTEATEEYDVPELWENIVASAVMGSLSLIGLTCYTMVLIVILRHRSQFRSTYYTLILSLAVIDILTLLIFLLYAVPCTLTQRLIFGEQFDRVVGALTAFTWYSGVMFICTIAVNRYWAVCRFASYKTVFSDSNGKRFALIGWLFGLLTFIVQLLPSFGQRFYPDGYSFSFDFTAPAFDLLTNFDRAFTVLFSVILIASYAAILRARPGRIGLSDAAVQPTSHINREARFQRMHFERNLALQFGLIALVLILTSICFTVLPNIPPLANRWGYFILTVLTIINGGLNPFIYLAFNHAIRSHFLATFCGREVKGQNAHNRHDENVVNVGTHGQSFTVNRTNTVNSAQAWN